MLATLRRSQDVTVRFLTSLPNAQEIIVVFFDQVQRLEHFDRENPEALFERVRTLPEGGNTALRDAIAFSLRALVEVERPVGAGAAHGRDRHRERDGAGGARPGRPVPPRSPSTRWPIRRRQTGDGPDPEQALKDLDRLAQVTGGRLFKLPNEAALPRVLDEIVADLRSQYVLGFTPETTGAPGRLRKISVKVPGRGKVVVRHRVGYRRGRPRPRPPPAAGRCGDGRAARAAEWVPTIKRCGARSTSARSRSS